MLQCLLFHAACVNYLSAAHAVTQSAIAIFFGRYDQKAARICATNASNGSEWKLRSHLHTFCRLGGGASTPDGGSLLVRLLGQALREASQMAARSPGARPGVSITKQTTKSPLHPPKQRAVKCPKVANPVEAESLRVMYTTCNTELIASTFQIKTLCKLLMLRIISVCGINKLTTYGLTCATKAWAFPSLHQRSDANNAHPPCEKCTIEKKPTSIHDDVLF